MTDILTPGLRERKREATTRRIAETAARLASESGVAGVTADQIAEAAEVSRATFFRYFETKETAIAEGFSGPRVDGILKSLIAQPARLGPIAALIATFREVGAADGDDVRRLVAEQARLIADSRSMQAWVAAAYLRDEELIAGVLADRSAADPRDPGPRLAAAAAMAAVRIGLEQWVAGDFEDDVTDLIVGALDRVRISGAR